MKMLDVEHSEITNHRHGREAYSVSHTTLRLFMSILWERLQNPLFRQKLLNEFFEPVKIFKEELTIGSNLAFIILY